MERVFQRRLPATIGALLVLLAGLAASPPAAGSGAMPRGEPVVRWRASLPAGVAGAPVVADGLVFAVAGFRTDRDVLSARDVATGAERWRVELAGSASGSAVANGVAYVGSGSIDRLRDRSEGVLRALDAVTGREEWRVPLPGPVGAPAVVDGTVYAASLDLSGLEEGGPMPPTWLVAVDAATGAERWRAATGTSGVLFPFPAVVAAGLVLALGEDGGSVVALEAATGAERWRSAFLTPIAAAPAVAGGLAFVTASFGLHALDLATGDERWVFPADPLESALARDLCCPSSPPAVAEGLVYAAFGEGGGDDQGVLVAVEAATGSERWRVDLGERVRAAPTLAGGTAYLGVGEQVVALDAATGSERWRLAVGGRVVAPVVVAAGAVYAGLVVATGGDDLPTGELVAIGAAIAPAPAGAATLSADAGSRAPSRERLQDRSRIVVFAHADVARVPS